MGAFEAAERYEEALERHRAEQIRKGDQRTPVEKLRDRLDYAAKLRHKAKETGRLVEWLNRRVQSRNAVGGDGKVTLTMGRLTRAWTLRFGPNQIELSVEQMEQIFTWAFQAQKDLEANADRIEKEVAG